MQQYKRVLRQFRPPCARELICLVALFVSSHDHLPLYSKVKLHVNCFFIPLIQILGFSIWSCTCRCMLALAMCFLVSTDITDYLFPSDVVKKCLVTVTVNSSLWCRWFTDNAKLLNARFQRCLLNYRNMCSCNFHIAPPERTIRICFACISSLRSVSKFCLCGKMWVAFDANFTFDMNTVISDLERMI